MCVLLCVNTMYYSSSMQCIEKYEEIATEQGYWM